MELWSPRVSRELVTGLRAIVAEHLAPIAAQIDRDDVYPRAAVEALARAGYNTLTFPAAIGGGGQPFASLVAVFEEVAQVSAATATSLITIFQCGEILGRYGSPAGAAYIARIADGMACSYAMTEAAHGSDVKHLDTRAVRDGDAWVITGTKSFVSGAGAADLFVILAETAAGVSAFAVPRATPGLQLVASARSATFGLRNGPHQDVVLAGARVPLDHLIGEDGRGIRIAATTLDHSRVLAAAISCGLARAAVDTALAYARDRVAFGKHILEFQGIQWYLADLVAQIDAARLLTYDAARHLDDASGELRDDRDTVRRAAVLDIERASSVAKLFASRVAVDATLQAIQICGATGCSETSPLGRMLRDAKTYEIAGGSTEILRNTLGKYLQAITAA